MALLTGSSVYTATVALTRPSNTTAYTAGDVVGAADTTTAANAGSAILTLPNISAAGGAIRIDSVCLFINNTAVPSGMDAFRLHLYSMPPMAILDNAAFDLTSTEMPRYLGFVALALPVDIGSTLYSGAVNVNKVVRMLPYSQTLFAELETRGAYTPASGTLYTVKLNTVEVDGATTDSENLLWAYAGGAVPTLDLEFARTKTLNNQVTRTPLVTFTRASSGTFVDSAGTLQTAATDVPRFDHNPTTGESLGLLVEEARTNLLLRSEEFDNADWGAQGAAPTITANTAISPSGTLTADTITFAAADSRLQGNLLSFTAGVSYTFSVYVKAVGVSLNKFRLAFFDGAQQNSADFTVSNLTWTRITSTFVAASTASGRVQIRNASDALANSLFVWGAQLEAGAFPTSYIPTTSATATRAADVASITGSAFSSWYNAAAMTIFSEASSASGAAYNGHVYSIGPEFNNSITHIRQSDFQPVGRIRNASVDEYGAIGNGAIWTGTLANRFALALSATSGRQASNGALATGSDDTSITFPAASSMSIGTLATGTLFLNGTIRRLAYWGQRLPNNVLQAITQ
jgi:hypothetical protein